MKKSIVAALLSIACSAAFSLSGRDVVQKYFDTNPAPKFSKTTFKVDSYKGKSLDDSIILEQYGRNKNGLTETVFEVTKSASSRGTRLLQSQKKGEDARFIYMPSLRTVRRIGIQDQTKSFVGTEFTYNDTSLRDIDDEEHELVSENQSVKTEGGNFNCWVVKSVPKSKREVEYDYRVQYFDHTSVMPIKIEYFDKTGKPMKTMTIKKLGTITGKSGTKHYTRLVTEMLNLKTNRSSVITIQKQILDEPLKDSYFTQNWLSTGKD